MSDSSWSKKVPILNTMNSVRDLDFFDIGQIVGFDLKHRAVKLSPGDALCQTSPCPSSGAYAFAC